MVRKLILSLGLFATKVWDSLFFNQRKITTSDEFWIDTYMMPGDVLLSTTRWTLSNLGISGFWKHAAIVTVDRKVIEAVSVGVRVTSLCEFIYKKDYVALMRPKDVDIAKRFKAAQLAEKQIGKPYDFSFAPNIDAFYCSELVEYVYRNDMQFTTRQRLGVETVLPHDIYLAKKFFDVLYISKEAKKHEAKISR